MSLTFAIYAFAGEELLTTPMQTTTMPAEGR